MERRAFMSSLFVAGAAGVGAVGFFVFRSPGVADALAAAPAPAKPPLMHVHKSPTCGCCKLWVDHVKQAGFNVVVFEEDDLGPVKERLGVPAGKGSCHTGEVEGYLVEGHVPAADIQRLLAERPQARGLVLPGMPIGSPGMEVPGTPAQPFVVELVRLDGQTEVFARHPSAAG